MSEVVVVGAGVVGLMTALRLHGEHDVTVLDAGPDPARAAFGIGATQSGCDARHVTRTETTTWTSALRSALVLQPTRDGGWDGRPPLAAGRTDQWIESFQTQASSSVLNRRSRELVLEVNRAGVDGWEALLSGDDALYRDAEVPTGGWIPILFTDQDAATEDFRIESMLDARVTRLDPRESVAIAPLLGRQVAYGIRVPGRAMRVKTLCRSIIERLRGFGCTLEFNTRVDEMSLPNADALVWASPYLLGGDDVLSLGLGGVIGVWLEASTSAAPSAFKLVAPEPINYINVTIDRGTAMASGGYAYVARHDAAELGTTIAALVDQLRMMLQLHVPGVDWSQARSVSCTRPSTPTGVPLAERLTDSNRRMYVIGAGCAGGFTHAPQQAEWTANQVARHT